MRGLRRLGPVVIAVVATWWLTTGTAAQSGIPTYAFVQSSSGQVFIVAKAGRVAIPIYPATDEEIAALPWTGRWMIPTDDGPGIGPQPAWSTRDITVIPSTEVAPTAEPTPSAVPAPTATAVPPTATTRKIGETTTLTAPSGLRLLVTVNDLDDNVKPGRYDSPAEGRYVVVDWTIKNDGSDDMAVNRLDFKLQTTDDFIIQRAGPTLREPDLTSARIGPGQAARGWLTYDVPKGARLKAAIYQPAGARQFVIADLSP